MLGFRRIRKHDKVLYRFCETRRMTTAILRNRGFELSKEDYLVLRQILVATTDTIHHYEDCKSTLFNFRKFQQRARELKSDAETVQRLANVRDPEIQAVIKSMQHALFNAFFTYTPLIKSEITISLLATIFIFLSKLGLARLNQTAMFFFWLKDQMKLPEQSSATA
jgi:hypothetical protein